MKIKFTCIAIIAILLTLCVNAQTSWQITGNSNITANNFIGTTNKTAFKMRTNNIVRMTINTNGNVGIGTTTPQSKLDVVGTITGYDSYFGKTYPLSAGTSGAGYSSVGYGLTYSDTTANYRYRINNDYSSMLEFRAGGFDFKTAPVGTVGNVIPYTPVMRIEQNGNVGIGTIQPANKFSVIGSTPYGTSLVFIENTGESVGSSGMNVKVNGGIGTYLIAFFDFKGQILGHIDQVNANNVSYSTSSDKRLKNIIGTSQKGLADLMKIRVYDYSFKSDPNKKVQTGFMAQELYEIFPQAVSKPRDTNEPAEKDPWMVDYGRITPLIIKAVQDQQQLIDDLKKQNEKMQKQIDELRSILISKSDTKTDDKQTALK